MVELIVLELVVIEMVMLELLVLGNGARVVGADV